MDYGLAGKVVVITGAGSGIGLATAQAFVTEGASVVAGDLEPGGLAQVAGPGRVTVVTVDLARAEGPATLVDTALRVHGRVDVLVNNVGIAPYRQGFLDVTDEDWRATLDVNFLSMVRACRAVIPSMIEHGSGVIVSLASDAGRQPDPFFTDYALSKAAILSLSKTLSIEFGPRGIRVNTVSPGPTHTAALDAFISRLSRDLSMPPDQGLDHFARVMRRLALGRVNAPEDVAAVILFLASDQARQVTGADYTVNAGSTSFV
jgi:NAD(P)-dependent dehydrogenase (short-subunit alcohol dehydrogenase family)